MSKRSTNTLFCKCPPDLGTTLGFRPKFSHYFGLILISLMSNFHQFVDRSLTIPHVQSWENNLIKSYQPRKRRGRSMPNINQGIVCCCFLYDEWEFMERWCLHVPEWKLPTQKAPFLEYVIISRCSPAN